MRTALQESEQVTRETSRPKDQALLSDAILELPAPGDGTHDSLLLLVQRYSAPMVRQSRIVEQRRQHAA